MGTIAGFDTKDLPLIADYSHWNGKIDLSKAAIDFAWFKACDGKLMNNGSAYDLGNYVDDTLYTNVQQAWDKGIPCGLYIYVQPVIPNYSIKSIIEHHFKVFKRAIGSLIPGKSFHAIALDIEEKGSTGPNVAEIVTGLFKMIADDPQLGKLPIFIYTSMAVLNMYTNLREQISWKDANYNGKPYLLWLAQWAWNATQRVQTTWEALRTVHLAPLSMKLSTPGFAVTGKSVPMAQIAANFQLPGCTVNITDLNVFFGTKAKLYELVNYTGTTPPPPPVEPPVTPPTADLTPLWAEIDAIKARMLKLEGHTHGGPLL